MIEKIKSGVQLNSVNLIESIFFRGDIEVEPNISNMDMGISLDSKEKDKLLTSVVTINIGDVYERENNEFAIQISMAGIFETIGDTPLTSEEFKNINAPAIIYPFIRQLARTISLDAGMAQLILPVINFQKHYQLTKDNDLT